MIPAVCVAILLSAVPLVAQETARQRHEMATNQWMQRWLEGDSAPLTDQTNHPSTLRSSCYGGRAQSASSVVKKIAASYPTHALSLGVRSPSNDRLSHAEPRTPADP
jgi:hypothetical protein